MNVGEALARKVIQSALVELYGNDVLWDFGNLYNTSASDEEKEAESKLQVIEFLEGNEADIAIAGHNTMFEVQLDTGSEPWFLIVNRHDSF